LALNVLRPASLGLVERLVSAAQDARSILLVGPAHGDADAGRDLEPTSADIKGTGHRCQDLSGDELRIFRSVQVGQQNHEFVARAPADRIARSH
jgi:hypothetical protein